MEKNDLINLWNEGNQKMLQTKNLDRSELEAFITPKINRATLGLNFNILFYMAVLIATMILIGIDLYGYRSNPTMLKVLMPMLILSSAFFGYGVFMISNIFQINRNDVDLMACIKKKLKIYRTHYEVWMWMMSLACLFLIFALNSMVDNDQGVYRINKPVFFAVVNVVILFFLYGAQKAAQWVSLRTVKTYLEDLQNEDISGTSRIEKDKKKLLIFTIILVIILTLTLIWGFIKAQAGV